MTIVLTGATGLLGSFILNQLLPESTKVYVLVRPESIGKFQKQILQLSDRGIWGDQVRSNACSKIITVESDLSLPGLGVEREKYREIISEAQVIIHSAATTKFLVSKEEAQNINLNGTKQVIDLASKCPDLKKMCYIGTSFVAGDFRGEFGEDDFNVRQKFNNNYEESKFYAEEFVRSTFTSRYSTMIFRPSIVIGSFVNGYTNNFHMFYDPMKIFSKELIDEVPANIETIHNLVPVDIAAQAIKLLLFGETGNKIFHIVSPNSIRSGEFMNSAAAYFGYKNPKFTPIEFFDFKKLSAVNRKLIEAFIPYFNYKATFAGSHTISLLSRYGMEMPKIGSSYFDRLFQYCEAVGFIDRRRRSSVH